MRETREEAARFAAAIGKVALLTAKREKPDKAVTMLYFEALKDFNIDTVEEIAERIMRTEPNLLTLPPPGRWRQIGEELFELRPIVTRPAGELPECDVCGDTGWRVRWEDRHPTGWRRVAVRCDHDGTDESTPPEAARPWSPTYEALDEERPPQPGETPLQARRREWGNRIFHCACCGYPYRRRTGWKCCAAPAGMSFQKWSELWHRDCEGKNLHRCPRHCQHPRDPQRGGLLSKEQMPQPGESMHDWAVRMGMRDPGAPHE